MRNDDEYDLTKAMEDPIGLEARKILDRFMVGYRDSCRLARNKNETFVMLRNSDFGEGEVESLILCIAVRYALGIGVKRVIVVADGYEVGDKVDKKELVGV